MSGCGDLRERLTLYRVSTDQDQGGGIPKDFALFRTIWCKVLPISKFLLAMAGGLDTIDKKIFRVRHDSQIDERMRIKYPPSDKNENWYEIKGIENIEEADRYLEITAQKIGSGRP